MKDLSTAILSHIAQDVTTLATGWLVVRRDGQSFAWTDHDEDVIIDGVNYRASLGLTPTSAHSTADFSVDTLDVTAFLDVSTEEEMVAGVWDGARVTVFEYDWTNPPSVLDSNVIILRHGTLGQLRRENNLFTAEVRGLTQQLSTRIGRAYSPTCPWRHAKWDGSTYVSSVECGLDLVAGGWIKDGIVTALGDPPTLIFMDTTSTAEFNQYFRDGLVTMTSGANSGMTREVADYAGDLSPDFDPGRYALYRPFPYALAIGDTFKAVKGDDKRYETCRDFFNNLEPVAGGGFGGMPFVPGIFSVNSNPTGV